MSQYFTLYVRNMSNRKVPSYNHVVIDGLVYFLVPYEDGVDFQERIDTLTSKVDSLRSTNRHIHSKILQKAILEKEKERSSPLSNNSDPRLLEAIVNTIVEAGCEETKARIVRSLRPYPANDVELGLEDLVSQGKLETFKDTSPGRGRKAWIYRVK